MGSSTASIDTTNVTWTFPAGSLKSTDNVVTVLFDQTGLEEDYFSSGSFRVNTFVFNVIYMTNSVIRHREASEAITLQVPRSKSGK
jgi:hypothetical protein